MGYAIMRFKKIKSILALNGVQRHNERRVPIKTLTHPENKNVNILISDTAENYQGKTFSTILKEKTNNSKIRQNAVLGLEFVFAFTPGCVKENNLKAWSEASVGFLAEWFGKENIISVVLHKDEGNPHIHAVVLPMVGNSLNCKHYINGPASCREMQNRYYEMVKDTGDLQRGINSKITHKVHQSHLRWIAENAQKAEELEMYHKLYGHLDNDKMSVVNFDTEDFQLSDVAI